MKIDFRPGDTIIVHEKIKESDKTRTHAFEGIVIAIRGSDINQSFTVRRIGIGGIGIERIWPINCPSIEKIVVKKKGEVKKAKLYYLRKRVGKQAMTIESKEEKTVKEPKTILSSIKKVKKAPVLANDQTKSQ